MKKLIIGLSLFLLILIVVLTLLLNRFKKNPSATADWSFFPRQTAGDTGNSRGTTAGNDQIGSRNSSSINGSRGADGNSTYSGSLTGMPIVGLNDSRSLSFSAGQRQFLQQLANKSYENADFRVSYDSILGKYIIEKITEQAYEGIGKWAQENGIASLIHNPDLFLLREKGQLFAYPVAASDQTVLTDVLSSRNPAIAALEPHMQSLLEGIKNDLPYNSQLLTISYSPQIDAFVIERKTADETAAAAEIQSWAAANNVEGIIGNGDIFIVTSESAQTIIPSIAAEKQNLEAYRKNEEEKAASNYILNFDDPNIIDFFKALFGGGKEADPSGTPAPTPSSTPPGDISDILALISGYGLPAPDQQEALRLKNQLAGNPKASWAAASLLAAERNVKNKGMDVKRYLTTAWVWFENGSGSWPDPYLINCNDNRSGYSSEVSFLCDVNNFQIAGYQAATRKGDYVRVYQTIYGTNPPAPAIQSAFGNSDKASRSVWNYNDGSQQKGLVSQYRNMVGQAALSDISPNSAFNSGKTQFLTLLLGKDPNMIIGLNTFAVSDSDLISGIKSQTCVYGYICPPQKQTLSNMIAALYLFETGSNGITTVTPTTGVPYPNPTQASSGIVAQIVYSINRQCPNGVVNGSTVGCLNRVTELTASAKYYLVKSVNEWYSLQCVGFVRSMAMQTTGRVILASGDAKNQLHNQNGYTAVYNNRQNWGRIKSGDILVWTGGAWGHIAYVNRVLDSQRGIVEVAEANISPGKVQLRAGVSLGNPSIGGWLTP